MISIMLLFCNPVEIYVSESESEVRVPLYASAPIAYDGTVYTRVDVARWSLDCTQI